MSRLLVLAAVCVVANLPAKPGPPTVDKGPAPAAVNQEPVDVQYCRAQLQLAKANLARVESLNRKVARTVPASIVAEQQHAVAVARVRLKQAESKGLSDEFSVWLERAEADYLEAQSRWKNAAEVNRQSARTFSVQEVERLRLRSEVYRLQFARGQSLANAPRDEQLAWRVELLTNELERVREDAIRISPVPRSYYYYSYPIWW